MSSRPLTTALLLPPSPHTSIASTLTFWTAPLTSALARPLTLPTLLYIGVPAPFPTTPRRTTFAPAQRLLTGLYSLVYRLTPRPASAVPFDVRIVLLSPEDEAEASFGPVMSTDQLADLQEWDVLLVPRGEAGYQLQGAFLAATGSPGVHVYYVDAGVRAPAGEVDAELAGAAGEGEEHAVVAVGGTFDHLHLGHKLLLTMTAYLLTSPSAAPATNPRLIVGLTGPAMLRNKKHAEFMESWEERSTRSLEFLRGVVDVTPFESRAAEGTGRGEGGDGDEKKLLSEVPEFREEGEGAGASEERRNLHIEIVSISDPFGPTITDPTVTALVVTQETASGGAAVNAKRTEAVWPELEVAVVDLLIAHDGEKLSSTELRRQKAV